MTGSLIDLPALVIAALMMAVLVLGVKESARINFAIVVKVLVVFFVIIVGAFYVDPGNWHPFAPYGLGGSGSSGGPSSAIRLREANRLACLPGRRRLFFVYLGFHAVSTQSEEANNPQRDLPVSIVGSLLFCTLLYIAVLLMFSLPAINWIRLGAWFVVGFLIYRYNNS